MRDVAFSLLERGLGVAAFSPRLGAVAEELKEAGVAVADRLEDLPFVPDIIHGHHHMEVIKALLGFPSAPAVLFCHGSVPWEEAPLVFPRIFRYLAVDAPCCLRLRESQGIEPGRVAVLPNFVDLDRFQTRSDPLPQRPKRAVLFSSTAARNKIEEVGMACQKGGIDLDLLGKISGRFCTHPERELGRYHLVFAKGRAALEAMAVGAAVVVLDFGKLGPMVRSQNFDRLRRLNFGLHAMDSELTVDNLMRQIRRYDRDDAGAVHQRIRREAGREQTVDHLMSLYAGVIEEHLKTPSQLEEEQRSAARYLEWVLPDLYGRSVELENELKGLRRTATLRMRERVLKTPLLGRAALSIARRIRRRT